VGSIRDIAKQYLFSIWTSEGIFFLIVCPVIYMKRVVFILLFLLLSVLVVSNKGSSFPMFNNIFIILFTAISCIRNYIRRQSEIVSFNMIKKRDYSPCIRRIRENIVS